MQLYNVPVIQPDLRHEETIIQTANAFEYLNCVINDVFDRIDKRIEANNNRVKSIRTRIDVANNKIDKLTGINKALTIFSPAKYPAANRSIDPIATFTTKTRSNIRFNKNYRIKSSFDAITHRDINDKLQFYHVPTVNDKSYLKRTQNNCQKLLENIETIDAVLLFNETINVYSGENIDKSWKRNDSTKQIIDSTERKLSMVAPPLSILNRKIIDKRANDELFYTPDLIEAPKIDAPHDLPDLPGIADDIEFNISDDLLMLNISDLPALPEVEPTQIEFIPNINAKENIPEISTTEPKPSAAISLQNVKTITSIPPPPPPPPPPPILQSQSTSKNTKMPEIVKSTPLPKPKIQEDNLHSNLMAAIRQAGGAGKAKLRGIEKCTPTQKAVPGGDLMADLHNKLALRRKGISGTKDVDYSKPNMIDRMSAMIPPPSKGSDSDDSNDNDNDNDDEWD